MPLFGGEEEGREDVNPTVDGGVFFFLPRSVSREGMGGGDLDGAESIPTIYSSPPSFLTGLPLEEIVLEGQALPSPPSPSVTTPLFSLGLLYYNIRLDKYFAFPGG